MTVYQGLGAAAAAPVPLSSSDDILLLAERHRIMAVRRSTGDGSSPTKAQLRTELHELHAEQGRRDLHLHERHQSVLHTQHMQHEALLGTALSHIENEANASHAAQANAMETSMSNRLHRIEAQAKLQIQELTERVTSEVALANRYWQSLEASEANAAAIKMQLQQAAQDLATQSQSAGSSRNKLVEQLQGLTAENQQLKANLQDANAQLAGLSVNIQTAEQSKLADKVAADKSIRSYEGQIQNLKEENERLQGEVRDLMEEQFDMQAKFNRLAPNTSAEPSQLVAVATPSATHNFHHGNGDVEYDAVGDVVDSHPDNQESEDMRQHPSSKTEYHRIDGSPPPEARIRIKPRESDQIELPPLPRNAREFRGWQQTAITNILEATPEPELCLVWIRGVEHGLQTLEEAPKALWDRKMFPTLDVKLAAAVNRIIKGPLQRQINLLSAKTIKDNAILSGRVMLWYVYKHFQLQVAAGSLLQFEQLKNLALQNDNLSVFMHEWDLTLMHMDKVPDELCSLRQLSDAQASKVCWRFIG